MKLFGWEIKRAEKEPEVVDENGKVVNKPTVKETACKVLGTVAALGAGAGMVVGAYVLGGKKVGREKDRKIADLDHENRQLIDDNEALYRQLHPEVEETEDEDEVE